MQEAHKNVEANLSKQSLGMFSPSSPPDSKACTSQSKSFFDCLSTSKLEPCEALWTWLHFRCLKLGFAWRERGFHRFHQAPGDPGVCLPWGRFTRSDWSLIRRFQPPEGCIWQCFHSECSARLDHTLFLCYQGEAKATCWVHFAVIRRERKDHRVPYKLPRLAVSTVCWCSW